MLSIVQVINKNTFRWFGHVMRRGEDSTLRVVMKLKMKGKRPGLRWLDNIDSHLKRKNTHLKEVLETKCLENRLSWRTLISQSTASGCGEDPWAPIWSTVAGMDGVIAIRSVIGMAELYGKVWVLVLGGCAINRNNALHITCISRTYHW